MIRFNFLSGFKGLAQGYEADAVIVSTEEGFSPLGASSTFLEEDLGISYENEIRKRARWNRDSNHGISLIGYASQNDEGLLRGAVLAPGENCKSYARYASTSLYSPRPNRDYYYNVTYESIAYLCRTLRAKKIAISHLSASGAFHPDIATCQVVALAHFCSEFPEYAPLSFTFCGCCIQDKHLFDARDLILFGGKWCSPCDRNLS